MTKTKPFSAINAFILQFSDLFNDFVQSSFPQFFTLFTNSIRAFIATMPTSYTMVIVVTIIIIAVYFNPPLGELIKAFFSTITNKVVSRWAQLNGTGVAAVAETATITNIEDIRIATTKRTTECINDVVDVLDQIKHYRIFLIDKDTTYEYTRSANAPDLYVTDNTALLQSGLNKVFNQAKKEYIDCVRDRITQPISDRAALFNDITKYA